MNFRTILVHLDRCDRSLALGARSKLEAGDVAFVETDSRVDPDHEFPRATRAVKLPL